MFQKACQLQWIEGFKVGSPTGNNVTVSHLLYADDTLLFCGEDRSQVIKLNLILHFFEAVSGLHTDMSKSTIYPVNFKANEIWSGIIEKFEKRHEHGKCSIFLLEEELH